MRTRIRLTIFLATLCAAVLATAQSSRQSYLPVDPTIISGKAPNVSIWDLSDFSPSATLPVAYTDHSFSYLSLEAALKLGINYVGVSASGKFSVLVAESRRFDVVPVKLVVTNTSGQVDSPLDAVALVGVACRVNVLTKAGEIESKVGTPLVGIEAHVKGISETMSFSAIGFTTYSPFALTVDSDGSVDLAEIRKSVIGVFNDYSKAAGDLTDAKPKLLGFRVAPDAIDISKVKSIKVISAP